MPGIAPVTVIAAATAASTVRMLGPKVKCLPVCKGPAGGAAKQQANAAEACAALVAGGPTRAAAHCVLV